MQQGRAKKLSLHQKIMYWVKQRNLVWIRILGSTEQLRWVSSKRTTKFWLSNPRKRILLPSRYELAKWYFFYDLN